VVITLTALAQAIRLGYPPVTLGQACLGGQCIAFCRAYVVLLSGVNPVLAIQSVVYIVYCQDFTTCSHFNCYQHSDGTLHLPRRSRSVLG